MFPTDDEVEDLLQHMDTDGEGGIELDEFLAHMADQIELRKKVNIVFNIVFNINAIIGIIVDTILILEKIIIFFLTQHYLG